MRLTPALSRWGLAAVAPILGVVAGVSEAGSAGVVRGTWAPEGMSLPYSDAHVVVAPMKLRLEASPVVVQLVDALKVPGLHKAFKQARKAKLTAHHEQKQQQRLEASEPQQAASDTTSAIQGLGGSLLPGKSRSKGSRSGSGDQDNTDGKGAASGKAEAGAGAGGSGVGILEAWVSGMRVDFKRSGAIQQRRVDMLIGPPGLRSSEDGLYLVLWGSANPDTDQLRMTVGLPPPTLARMGVRESDLPEGYCMPIPLGGTISAPRLQVKGVAARAAQLVINQAAHHAVRQQERKEEDKRSEASSGSRQGTEGAGEGVGSGSVTSAGDEEGKAEGQSSADEQAGIPGSSSSTTTSIKAAASKPAGTAKAVGAWLVKKGVSWMLDSIAPAGKTSSNIWQQLQEDAQAVPAQLQPVPWVRGSEQPDSAPAAAPATVPGGGAAA